MAPMVSGKATSILRGTTFQSLCLAWIFVLGSCLMIWRGLVNEIVPKPYLVRMNTIHALVPNHGECECRLIASKDEIFHVPQAQRYCVNNLEWDPKITTPPGVYILSRLAHCLGVQCSPSALRGINVILTLFLIFPASFLIRASSNSFALDSTDPTNQTALRRRLAADLHSAVNVCLFPPLFFFTSLYYTDVGSTGVVLLFIALLTGRASFIGEAGQLLLMTISHFVSIMIGQYTNWKASSMMIGLGFSLCWPISKFSGRTMRPVPTYADQGTPGWLLILAGLFALVFRQTNVFWVGVFPIGCQLLSHAARRSESEGKGFLSIHPRRCKDWDKIINPTVESADILGNTSPPLHSRPATNVRRLHSHSTNNDLLVAVQSCSEQVAITGYN